MAALKLTTPDGVKRSILMKNIKISKKEVEHIGRLARIKLTKKEIEKYSKELSKILDYIKKLNEVNTNNIEPTSQIGDLFNIFRKNDEPDKFEIKKINSLISQLPKSENNFLKIPSVFGKSRKSL